MKKKKLVYIISNIDKALAFEWIADSEKLKEEFDMQFILMNPYKSVLFKYLLEKGYKVHWIPYAGKKDILIVVWKIFRYLKREEVDIVHTHLFDACIAGLLAAKMVGVPKRIYTRHHSTLHHVYFPRAVYYDKFINSLATDIIAISKVVKQVLIQKEFVSKQKVHLIHHGFDLDLFNDVSLDQINQVATRHRIPLDSHPRIGVIARYTYWKGIHYIIDAFKKLQKVYPESHLILANAKGDYSTEIKACLAELSEESYTEILFEEDIPALYKLFDVYVHVPIDEHSEAFGQTYVEALAAGVPAVFTLSGVASEFVKHKHNAYVVNFQDATAIAEAVRELLSNKELSAQLIKQGHYDVHKEFTFEKMASALEKLYNR